MKTSRPWMMLTGAYEGGRDQAARFPPASSEALGFFTWPVDSCPQPPHIVVAPFQGIRSLAEHDRNLNLSSPLEHFHGDLVGVTAYLQVDAGLLELQVAQHQFVQERRQTRVAQADLVRNGIELKSERSLNEREG